VLAEIQEETERDESGTQELRKKTKKRHLEDSETKKYAFSFSGGSYARPATSRIVLAACPS